MFYHTELVLKDEEGNEVANFALKTGFAPEAVENLQKYHHGLDITRHKGRNHSRL